MSFEQFKLTIWGAKNDSKLKAGSKSSKMILQRHVKNLNEYENEICSIESTLITWVIKGEPIYNPKSAHQGKLRWFFYF